MIRHNKKIIPVLLLTGLVAVAKAAPIVTFDFDTNATDPSPGNTDTTTTATIGFASADSNVTASDISNADAPGGLEFYRIRNPFSGAAYSSDVLIIGAASAGASFDSDDAFGNTPGEYIEFTVTATSGYVLNLDDLTFNTARGGSSGTRSWALRTSLTSGDFATGTPTAIRTNGGTTMDNELVDLSAGTFQNITSVTFQLATISDASGLAIDYDDIVLNGTVTAIPEPSSLGLMGLALGLFSMMYRRSRRN